MLKATRLPFELSCEQALSALLCQEKEKEKKEESRKYKQEILTFRLCVQKNIRPGMYFL